MKPEEIFTIAQDLNKGDLIGMETGEGFNETGNFASFENNVIKYYHVSSNNPIDLAYDRQIKEINIGRLVSVRLLFPSNL